MVIYIRVKDSITYITGEVKVLVSALGPTNDYLTVENRGMKNSPGKIAFDTMNDIALSLSEEIEYAKF